MKERWMIRKLYVDKKRKRIEESWSIKRKWKRDRRGKTIEMRNRERVSKEYMTMKLLRENNRKRIWEGRKSKVEKIKTISMKIKSGNVKQWKIKDEKHCSVKNQVWKWSTVWKHESM